MGSRMVVEEFREGFQSWINFFSERSMYLEDDIWENFSVY